VYPKQNPRFLSHKTKPSGQKHKMWLIHSKHATSLRIEGERTR
jgi:hypothetical protein